MHCCCVILSYNLCSEKKKKRFCFHWNEIPKIHPTKLLYSADNDARTIHFYGLSFQTGLDMFLISKIFVNICKSFNINHQHIKEKHVSWRRRYSMDMQGISILCVPDQELKVFQVLSQNQLNFLGNDGHKQKFVLENTPRVFCESTEHKTSIQPMLIYKNADNVRMHFAFSLSIFREPGSACGPTLHSYTCLCVRVINKLTKIFTVNCS